MHVKHVKVNNFRGIRDLNWTVKGAMIGLVGPGDSTKTTILDAIEYALSSRWSLPISDSDFYGGKPESPIIIEITVGDVPSELLKDDKYGLHVRGWKPEGSIVDEPTDDCDTVLTIRLTITSDYETSWGVVTDRHAESKSIPWRDRARLGVVRLGAEVDRDLAWGRGSSLSRLTATTDVEGVLATAYRAARNLVTQDQLASFAEAARTAAERARHLGATVASDFKPALDSAAMSVHLGALSLHDGLIPVRATGLGTRRLVALGIQQAVVRDGAILLIDEIEHALEPHRIRHLIRHLRKTTEAGDANPTGGNRHGQVLMTTHSQTAVVELRVDETRIVRSNSGETKVLAPDSSLQGVLRAAPEALLGRRIVVCEGKTEIGLCWGLEVYWQSSHSDESTACRGVVFVDGEGSSASRRALDLATLGYDVAYLGDSDKEINPTSAELAEGGVRVIQWDGNTSTEQRIFADLPLPLVQEVFDLAIKEHGQESVIASVAHHLKRDVNTLRGTLSSWMNADTNEQAVRDALGKAAKGNEQRSAWYKHYDRAAKLASIITKGFPIIDNTDLGSKLRSLEKWCYE